MVDIDSNAILAEPMKSCKDAEMIWAYDALLQRLKRVGIIKKTSPQQQSIQEHEKPHLQHTQV